LTNIIPQNIPNQQDVEEEKAEPKKPKNKNSKTAKQQQPIPRLMSSNPR
jgi:hypothetical protein